MTRNTRASSSEMSVNCENILTQIKNNDCKLIVNFIQNEFKSMDDKFSSLLISKNGEIDGLKKQIQHMSSEMEKMKNYIDDSDAYERRDTIILSGSALPSVTNGENCIDITRDILHTKLKLVVPASEFNTAHRLGARPDGRTPDKRSIIVKLCRRETKRNIIITSKKTRDSNLYVNESLTPTRRTIFNTLRKMKANHPDIVKGCTTYDGRVFAFTKPPMSAPTGSRDVKHLVNSHTQLVKFCIDYVKLPLETFLEGWSH